MYHFMYVTILSMLTIFLSIQSDEQLQFLSPYKLFKTRDCPKDLDVYKVNANGGIPSKIIESEFRTTTFGFNYVRLDIKWLADIRNVKGFKIVLKPSNKPEICRILDYSDVITDSSSGMYSFEYKFRRIYANRSWKAQLYPLPNVADTSESITFDSFPDPERYDCSSYAPSFVYYYEGTNLQVTLTKGPESCNFEEYQILVLDENYVKVTQKIIPNTNDAGIVGKLETDFEMKIPKRGYYYILVNVHDRFFNDQERCKCKDMDGLCRRCPISITKKTYFIPGVPRDGP